MTRDELFASIVAAGPDRDDPAYMKRRGDSYDWRFLTVMETGAAANTADRCRWPVDEPQPHHAHQH
jgi:hypothetical protein